MKKRTKLIALAMAAVVWIASMGTLLVYVLGKNSPFSGSSKFTGGKVVLSADKDIGNNLSQLIRESAYSSANDTVDSMTAFTENYPAGLKQITVTGGMADRLEIGNSSNEQAHTLALSGGAVKKDMQIETGTLKKDYKTVEFAKKGATAQFVLDLSKPVPKNSNEPVWLEVEEIHRSTTQSFGYTVLVNGQEVYFRTYEMIASAPNHYFIQVNRSAIGDLSHTTVTFRSESNRPFNVSAVYAYTNFSELVENEKIYQKLGINFYSGTSTDTAEATVASFPKDYGMYDTGMMLSLKYMNINSTEAASQLDSYIQSAENAQSNLQIMSAMYWSNSPYSPDGLGGSFSDLKYSQVLYNSALKQYVPSTPNVYSSTQWVTSGSSVLNNAAVSKINSFFSDFATSMNFKRARGIVTRPLDLVMEWGVCYKGISTLTGYSNAGALDGGDFHPELIAAAAADGVTLNPADGLSYEEKAWMMNWQARYNQMLANAYRTALGTDAVQVSGTNYYLPKTQTFDHIFTHNVSWINQNPSYDLTISGWQAGVGENMYSSSEDMYFNPVRFYQYKAAFGRTGCVNLEMAIHNPKGVFQSYIKQAYEQGLEFVTLFNDKTTYGTADRLREIDGIESSQASAPEHFDVNIFDKDYTRDVATESIANPPANVTYSNIALKDGRAGLADTTKAGTITIELTDNGETFDTGLYVTTMQLANSKTPFAVYGGTSKSSLAKLSTGVVQAHSDRFDDTLHYKYNIATQTKNLNRYYIQIRIPAGSTDLLRAVKVYRPFTKQSGQLNGLTTTLKTARLQNLLVSKRAETENIYREYLKEHGKKDRIIGFADSLMKAGCYSTAHELLSGEISQVLPAKYLIKGSADLVRYPVSVQLANASDMVQMTLTEVSASGMSFRFDTEKAQSVTLKFNGLKNEKRYAVQSLGNNAFRLVETTGGTLRPTNGKLTHTVNVTLPQAATHQSISGRAYANASGSTITLTVQNPAISNYSLYEKYTAASSCVFTRHKDGSTTSSTTRPRAGDYVILTFNSNNQVTKCESVYGEKTAKIKTFTPPSVTAGGNNGVVEFTDGTKFELENQAKTTDITYVDSTGEEQYTYARYCTAAQLKSIFKVGKTITVTYCPETYNGSMKRLLTAIIP